MTMNKEIRTTTGQGKLYQNVLETIGNTPVIKLDKFSHNNTSIYVKAEFFNPAGSIKDRLAINIIEDAEREGLLMPGQTVIEATSGNTGVGLAMVCAQKGYPLVIVMAESFSIERRKLMRMYGAKVILTPKEEKGLGMYKKAIELAKLNGWFLASQFESKANADIHQQTTAQEIINDFKGKKLDYIVTGYGTGGTVTGIGREIRSKLKDTKIILTEPENAALISSGEHQERSSEGFASKSHSAFQPHLIQGWTPDFIPLVLQETIDKDLFDDLIKISGPESIDSSIKLAQREGILTGISGGGTLAVAVKLANTVKDGSVILAMLPDTGERYLSTMLFEEISEDMNEEEIKIMKSTPGFHLNN